MPALRRICAASALALAPLAAQAQELTPARVFADAALFPQAIMLGLIPAAIASVVIAARKLSSGPRLAGGSAFVSGVRLGGPLVGALGATYVLLNGMIGIANVPIEPTLKIMAPGFAEAVLLFGLGLFAGAVAVIAHWAIEARIDREVLKG